MNKLERYIEYIVNDLVKDTRIDTNFIWGPIFNNNKGRVITPWNTRYQFNEFPLPNILASTYTSYLQERYGTRDKEAQKVWVLYKERIYTLIS